LGVNHDSTPGEALWYSGPAFDKRVSWRELADQLTQMPGATANLNLTRFRVTAAGDEFVISAERADLPAASWVPLINHVEPVLGKPTN